MSAKFTELYELAGVIIGEANKIAIIQADNPDGDSLGSALALEHIVGDLGKEPLLYCGVDMPHYLRYMEGWDRVTDELPSDIDAAVIVDTSTPTLLEKLVEQGLDKKLHKTPTVVLDHHRSVEQQISYADVVINDPAKSSTGELLFSLATHHDWSINHQAAEHIMTAILGDTQGLSNDLATSTTYQAMATLIEFGANRPALEEKRRAFGKMPEVIYRYKAKLIERTELAVNGLLAYVVLTQEEINQYSPLYNPAPLIQGDMLQIDSVGVSIVIKKYDDGKITGSIRANPAYPYAAKIAASLGGGGHQYAAGFKTQGNTSLDLVLRDIHDTLEQALDDAQSTSSKEGAS